MRPAEVIHFMAIGMVLLLVLALLFILLRKRKKLAIVLSIPLVLTYGSYYLYYPTLQENIHSKRYELLQAYLSSTYPEKQFVIYPAVLEPGVDAGNFQVNTVESPEIGVEYRVKSDGSVTQLGTWTNTDYPTQQTLWKTVKYNALGNYTLEEEIPIVEKKDMWIDGELTVFALTVDDKPTIAIYYYSSGSYSQIIQQQAKPANIVTAEYESRLFVLIDEQYPEPTATIHALSGEPLSIDVNENKGRLLVFP